MASSIAASFASLVLIRSFRWDGNINDAFQFWRIKTYYLACNVFVAQDEVHWHARLATDLLKATYGLYLFRISANKSDALIRVIQVKVPPLENRQHYRRWSTPALMHFDHDSAGL